MENEQQRVVDIQSADGVGKQDPSSCLLDGSFGVEACSTELLKRAIAVDESIIQDKPISTETELNKVDATCIFLSASIVGVVLPGIPAWPLLLAGGREIFPNSPTAKKLGLWFKRKLPKVHRETNHFPKRFISDFKKRFPD